MDEKVKLFFELKNIYPDLTVADVEGYYGASVKTQAEYSYTTEKGTCAITKTIDGKTEIVSRIKGTDADAASKIEELQKSDSYDQAKDGLLQYVYDKLKTGAISK